MALFEEFIPDAAYQRDCAKDFEILTQANDENVEAYTRNVKIY